MYRLIIYIYLVCLLCSCNYLYAQQNLEAKAKPVVGVVYDANTKKPLKNVQVSSRDAVRSVVSGEKGHFRMGVRDVNAVLTVVSSGYFSSDVNLFGRDSIAVYLQPADKTMATDRYTTPDGERSMEYKNSSASALNRTELGQGYFRTSDVLTGRFAGLRVLNKSGMLGEGSFVNMRGARSLLAQNTPLIVIDGVPIMPDYKLSNVVNGFSRDVMEAINLKEIEQVTFLKGADALAYGSMGSNGVLLVDTETGLDKETRVELYSVEGVSFINKRIPMMNGIDFKKYISDIAGSRYPDVTMQETMFPFLKESMTDLEKKRYGYNMDWQKEIYTPAFNSENMLKVKGGDAVVKFMLTAGFQANDGVVEGTSQSKFYTRGNTNINFSENLTATASVAFDFSQLEMLEQGLSQQTNPLLASYAYSPLTGIFDLDNNGKLLTDYSKVDPIMGISNPVALRDGVMTKNKMYDILINTGVGYKINRFIKLNLGFGIYYNYIKDDLFIGGKTSGAIAPLMGGLALNTVRSGSSETKNYYGKASLTYDRTFNTKHNLKANLAWQLMASSQEASNGEGINTSSDKYKNLTNVNNNIGRVAYGYIDIWNWMNAYLLANYTYNQQLFATGAVMVDAASTYGRNGDRYYAYPAVKMGWKMDNAPFLRNSDLVSNLTVRGEYSINPNSRYSSKYGKYYYVLKMLRDVSGLVRASIPNEKIAPEEVHNIDFGVDFSILGDRVTVSADVYEENTRHMIIEQDASPVLGFNSAYKNSGSMRSRGAEVNLSALLLNRNGFYWRVGGNIAHFKTEITSMGGDKESIIDLGDEVTVINRVGLSPFSFYGNKTQGVFSTSQQAEKEKLRTSSGYAFTGGDMRFKDLNGDHVIGDADKEVLGSATPDFYGGFYSQMTYRGFSLFMNFSYSYGNEIYNGIRRMNESGTSFTNQANSVSRRWVVEGQQTDIPKVEFGDPGGNNRFSSRWIEDGSFVKLKEITLSYETKKKLLFLTGLKVFVSAENLLTFTKYTGSDPEFSYSYDQELLGMDIGKVPVPKFVKLGLILNF